MEADRDSTRWIARGIALAVLVIGWVLIAWTNRFHLSTPLVVVCLGYLAAVATIYNLWRVGASAVAAAEDDDDSTWARPTGATAELQREKRTLLKAIKEAEFDFQMGKLSQRDADDMIAMYKARVYEVYRELDKLELGAPGSKREQILREVKARLDVEAKSKKAEPGKKAKKAKAAEAKPAVDEAKPASEAELDGADAKPDGEPRAAEAVEPAAAHASEPEVVALTSPASADDELEADSTTAYEPEAKPAAKEATP
jgi:hypothetical protein